jgi:hypothetical protein
MSASFTIMKNGVATAVTSAAIKTNTPHGNPAGEGKGVGKFSVKVRSTGPISGD